jgi:prepilin-type N-terminal cleavage/methylation domain-containing protein
MQTIRSESGFTLIELLIATLITATVMGVAFTTFSNALALNDAAVQVADSSQNLRVGTNLLVRDLLQVGRNIPIGGIPIPSGAGSTAIHRPSPPGESYTFDNDDAVTIGAITTGDGLGPAVGGRRTDMITLITMDPFQEDLSLKPATATGTVPKLAANGRSFHVGTRLDWLQGDLNEGVAAIKPGDLIYFNAAAAQTLQTVTRVSGATVYFDANDPFNLNQAGAEAGSITQVVGAWDVDVRRVFMHTYYVHEDVPGVPRLMRVLNHFPPQALAGVIEDLDLSYDLVDGIYNPVNIRTLPYTANGVTYSASQIRKVNIHLGVRSELKSVKSNDYLRNHVSTVISLRNLAYVARYN